MTSSICNWRSYIDTVRTRIKFIVGDYVDCDWLWRHLIPWEFRFILTIDACRGKSGNPCDTNVWYILHFIDDLFKRIRWIFIVMNVRTITYLLIYYCEKSDCKLSTYYIIYQWINVSYIHIEHYRFLKKGFDFHTGYKPAEWYFV